MNDFEFQIHRDPIRFAYELQLGRVLPPEGVTLTRGTEELPSGSHLHRIPPGAFAHVQFRVATAAAQRQFRRLSYNEGTFDLTGQGNNQGPKVREFTEVAAALTATVTIRRSADKSLIEIFEVPGHAIATLTAGHENRWEPPASVREQPRLLGARIRIVCSVGRLEPDPLDDNEATALVKAAFDGIGLALLGREVFPLPPLIPPPATQQGQTNAAWLSLDALTRLTVAPVAHSGVVMTRGSAPDAVGEHITLRAELSRTGRATVSENMPGDVAEWLDFYVQHPPDLTDGKQWSVTLPAQALVRSTADSLRGERRPEPGLVMHDGAAVTWTPAGELKVQVTGSVYSIGDFALTNPLGDTHPVDFEAEIVFSFRSEVRSLTRVKDGQTVTEPGLALIIDARLNLDIDEGDVIVVSIGLALAGAIIGAGIGGIIGGLVGVAIGAAIGAAVVEVLTGVLAAMLPSLALAAIPAPSANLAGTNIPMTKLDDDHYEAVIDAQQIGNLIMGNSSGGQMTILRAIGTARGLLLSGSIDEFLMLLLSPHERRLSFRASPQFEWGWIDACTTAPKIVAQAELTPDSWSSPEMMITAVEVEDPSASYGTDVVSVRRSSGKGIVAPLPVRALDVVIVVEVPEARPASLGGAPPLVVRITDSLGQVHRLSIGAPPPLDTAQRDALTSLLEDLKKVCNMAGGFIRFEEGELQIELPISDPPGWGSLRPSPDLRDLLTFAVAGLQPGRVVILHGPGGRPLAEQAVSASGVALFNLPVEADWQGHSLSLRGAPTDGPLRWFVRRRRVEAAGRTTYPRAALHLTPEGPAFTEGGRLDAIAARPLHAAALRDTRGDRWWAEAGRDGLTAWRLLADTTHTGEWAPEQPLGPGMWTQPRFRLPR